MARRSEARIRLIVGMFVVVLSALLFVSLFIICQSEGTWEKKTSIYTDFRTITGLRRGSPVQLAGVEIGNVESIDFLHTTYECDPLTEDLGRFGAGRTDNCDVFLFCAPSGECAELEPFASKGMHTPCLSTEDCAQDEICVTREFRRRTRRVQWVGPDGVCARYITEHRRVRVGMKIFEDKLHLVRTDSHATVASNGVLGDQLINITPGMREPLGENRRIQSTPSLYEDIELFRERIDGLTDKVDSSLAGISSLFSELNDERTISAVKGTIENVNEITRQFAQGEGLLGALLNDDEFKEDFGKSLRSVRDTAKGVDQFVSQANRTLSSVDKDLQPVVADARKTLEQTRKTLEDLKDPANKSLLSKLMYDTDGKLVEDFETVIAELEKFTKSASNVAKKVEKGEGTLGKLVTDSKPHDDLVKILSDLERNNSFKRVVRYMMELEEDGQQAKGGSKRRRR